MEEVEEVEGGDSDGKGLPRHAFFRISIAGTVQPGTVVFELDVQSRPETCRSFLALCTSPRTTTRASPEPSYRGCEFHRVVPGMCVQTGDFERFDGTGGYSPLFGRTFADEWGPPPQTSSSSSAARGRRHDGEGVLSMANRGGKDTNGSQWFVTLKPCPHLDGVHVAFGTVVRGMETVRRMADVDRDGRGRPVPMQRVVITDCGAGTGGAEEGPAGETCGPGTAAGGRLGRRRRHGEEEDDDARRRRRKKLPSSSSRPGRKGEPPRRDDDDVAGCYSSDSQQERKPPSRKRKHKRREGDDEDDDSDSTSCATDNSASSESAHARRRRRKKEKKKEKNKKKKKGSKKRSKERI